MRAGEEEQRTDGHETQAEHSRSCIRYGRRRYYQAQPFSHFQYTILWYKETPTQKMNEFLWLYVSAYQILKVTD